MEAKGRDNKEFLELDREPKTPALRFRTINKDTGAPMRRVPLDLTGNGLVIASIETNANGYGIFHLDLNWREMTIGLKLGSGFLVCNLEKEIQLPIPAIHELKLSPDQLPETLETQGLNFSYGSLTVDDVNLVPSLFPDLGSGVFGTSYCERILPTDEAPLIHDIVDLVKTQSETLNIKQSEDCCGEETCCAELDIDRGRITVGHGEMLKYVNRWDFLGLSLGSLIKSISLLPCEKISFATLNWERAYRFEGEESQSERLQQFSEVQRSQSATEVLNSISTKLNLGYGRGIKAGMNLGGKLSDLFNIGVNVASGSTANVGYSRHKFAANSTRQTSERAAASASSLRQTRKISIMEVSEAHRQDESVRTICNNNHCHTLNVFFRQVIENYKLSTIYHGHQDIIFLPYKVKELTAECISCHRDILSAALLDSSLSDGFEALEKVLHYHSQGDDGGDDGSNQVANTTNRFRIDVSIGGNGLNKNAKVELKIELSSGQILSYPIHTPDRWKRHQSYTHYVDTAAIDPSMITRIGIRNGGGGVSAAVEISQASFSFLQSGGGWVTVAIGPLGKIKRNAEAYLPVSYSAPSNEDSANDTLFDQSIEYAKQDSAQANALLAHIHCNLHYYNQILWLNQDINQRICCFEKIQVGNQILADMIHPAPLGILGCYVAFRAADSDFVSVPPVIKDERLIPLETSGVFADAALGRCSTCEEINDTEYWDWSDTPCNCGNQISPSSINTTGLPSAIYSSNGELANLLNGLLKAGAIPDSVFGDMLAKLVTEKPEILTEIIKQLSNDSGKNEDENGGSSDSGGGSD